MNQPPPSPVESMLREELAQGDNVLVSLAPVLAHLVATASNALFNDQVIASIRGRAHHVARQLLTADESAAASADVDTHAETAIEELADEMMSQQAFLLHCHALTIEAQTALELQRRSGIDPVVPPMLQSLIASSDAAIAAGAMAILAAQARFFRQQERMELPLQELPAPIFEQAIESWKSIAGSEEPAAFARTEAGLRACYDEGAGRIGLLDRMIATLGKDAMTALSVGNGGLAMFSSAVAAATGQPRDRVIVATSEQQLGRLALSLRAAGLDPAQIEQQFHCLHPDVSLPEGFEALRQDRAREMLAQSHIAGN